MNGQYTDPVDINGILIHGAFYVNEFCSTTYLLDASPESLPDWPDEISNVAAGDFADSFLLIGNIFYDQYNHILITPLGLTEDGGIEVSILMDICMQDLDNDGIVGSQDLALLLGAWGINPGHPADITGNGIVNADDLALLLGNWGFCTNDSSSLIEIPDDAEIMPKEKFGNRNQLK